MIDASRIHITKLWENRKLGSGQDSESPRASHAGLLLSRFLKTAGDSGDGKRTLLTQSMEAVKHANALYEAAFSRWKRHCSESENRAYAETQLQVQGRLSVGLGEDSVLETGIALHHTYGTPLIPGSALKGLAAHYCDQVWGKQVCGKQVCGKRKSEFSREMTFVEEGREQRRVGNYYRELFGTTDESGHIHFHDAWIIPDSLRAEGQGLVLDVMTPHHSEYYMANSDDETRAPTDYDSPNPVTFLSVSGTFVVVVSCDGSEENGRRWANLALSLLTQAMKYWGVGAKTNAGYGRLRDPSDVDDCVHDEGTSPKIVPKGPRYKVGDEVVVTKIDDPKEKNRMWFQADDGFGGVVTRGTVPQIEMGETGTLWIAAVSNGYNFSAEAPKSLPNARKQGKGRRPR